jgi:organic hydroperoxide reductase OsmC/OhrA
VFRRLLLEILRRYAVARRSHMAPSLPYRYQVLLEQRGHETVLSDGVKPVLVGGPPPEFGGEARWWTPEHLLVSSVGLCFTTTFRALAARTELAPRWYAAEAEGVLDKAAGGLRFVSFLIRVTLEVGPGQAELARALLERAHRACLVAKSLNVPVELVSTVEESTEFAPATHPALRRTPRSGLAARALPVA